LSIKANISVTSKNLIDALMFTKERTKKDKRSRFTQDTTEPIRDGRFSILTKKQRLRLRA
jgi:hypothetical protein